MIQIEGSCNPQKLKKVLIASRAVLKTFYGLTEGDKEDILMDVCYRFEVDKARFPVSVYATHCRNKIIGFLGKKTAKKRMNQSIRDGKVTYYEDISLNAMVGEDGDVERESLIPTKENPYSEVEFLMDVERKAPELLPLVKSALRGDPIKKKERELLKSIIDREDLVG